MPIKPVTGTQPLPVDSPGDVAVLVEALARPKADTRALGDHFAYLAGTRPEWFQPHQEHVIEDLLDRLDIGFAEMCVLFAGAPDRCVEVLAQRLRHFSRPGPRNGIYPNPSSPTRPAGTDTALKRHTWRNYQAIDG